MIKKIKKKKKLEAQTVYNPMYILKDVLVSIYIVGQIFILWDSKEEKDSEFLFVCSGGLLRK